tara:strand:- start:7229 stop:7969 length:741 start_codon:yes stop_codon:yes gene_type:complete
MSDRTNKPDAGDYAEAGMQGLSTTSAILKAAKRAGRLTKALGKKLNPVEGGLTAWEALQLVPGFRTYDAVERAKAEREEAEAEVEAMATDPNVLQVDRFIKGLADPVRVGYGITKGFQRMQRNVADMHKANMDLHKTQRKHVENFLAKISAEDKKRKERRGLPPSERLRLYKKDIVDKVIADERKFSEVQRRQPRPDSKVIANELKMLQSLLDKRLPVEGGRNLEVHKSLVGKKIKALEEALEESL